MKKNLLFSALGIGRAMVLCINAELVNPCKALFISPSSSCYFSINICSPTPIFPGVSRILSSNCQF